MSRKRSHHKGKYVIINGSDKEPGGVRRGPKRKPPKKEPGFWEKVWEDVKKDLAAEAKKLAKEALRKKLKRGPKRKPGRPRRSHHRGKYRIINGSDKEPTGIRTGPRRLVTNDARLAGWRAKARERQKKRRGR